MTKHIGFRNNKLFCFNCGGDYEIPFPQPINMAIAMIKQFEKDHKKCQKTWKEPEAAPDKQDTYAAMFKNYQWWIQHGEHGISSKTMLNHILRSDVIKNYSKCHPLDPDDFRRCYLLLKAVPQLRKDLHTMKSLSWQWANLVDNWDKLTELLEEQLVTKKPNGMYELMESLITTKGV